MWFWNLDFVVINRIFVFTWVVCSGLRFADLFEAIISRVD